MKTARSDRLEKPINARRQKNITITTCSRCGGFFDEDGTCFSCATLAGEIERIAEIDDEQPSR